MGNTQIHKGTHLETSLETALKQRTEWIPVEECKNGGLYIVDARNFELAIYREADKSFLGIRTKFNDKYIFPEVHWDACSTYGTVKPIKFIKMSGIVDLMTIDDKEIFRYLEEQVDNENKTYQDKEHK